MKNLGIETATRKGQRAGFRFSLSMLMVIFLLLAVAAKAQVPVQQVRGTISDQVLGTPIAGATVTILPINKTIVTDEKGGFRFIDVPVGSVQLKITCVGYKDVILENIHVNAGKEVVLTVSMENSIREDDEVVIKTSSRKNKPLNEMSAVSARAFTVEETQRYAAAVNDPLRMAAGFPGVFATDDGNNSIAIRGNSPTGLLWRMEGLDIPNPNHFSGAGSSGGGISILSSQLLSNSDFMTSAFASEYGNALSGVFDLKLRKGNNEKREYALQAGFLGLNAAAEGPFSSSYRGSYLVNYRYSTLSLLDKLGVPMEGGITNFQDLSFNIYLPTNKMGTFTWFGFGGLSTQDTEADTDSSKWETKSDRYDSKFVSHTGATGITHNILLGSKTSLRSAAGFSYSRLAEEYYYIKDDYTRREDYNDSYKTAKWIISSTLNHKLSQKHTIRAGAIASIIKFDYYKKERDNDSAPLEEVINAKDATQTIQAFAQWQYRPMNNLTFNGGLHFLQLLYNNSKAIEPRASVKWQADARNSIALGYGGHSQIQGLGVYFAKSDDGMGNVVYPNKDLKLTRAHHLVLSYHHMFSRKLSLKTEIYYQHLYKVPVSAYDTSTFSVLNIHNAYVTDPLVNKGKGRNYGVEISLERYYDEGLYYTLSTSVFESKYKALDGVERDTKFNSNYIMSLVAGKEFMSSNKLKTFGINIKTIYAGGLRTTPIDQVASIQAGKTIYDEQAAFTLQNDAYFRSDLRVSMKWNRKRITSTLSLDIQNVTNRLNVYGQWFDSDNQKIETSYQTGLIPVLNYKIEF